jgi:outer membrane lipoprotein-sorting protein
MRFAVLTLFLAAPTLPAQDNEAEKLFRAVEHKIVSAKAVQMSGEMDIKGSKSEAKMKLALLFAEGNKARLSVRVDKGGQEVTMTLISDGKQMAVTVTPPGKKTQVLTPPADLQRMLAVGGARTGLMSGFYEINRAVGRVVAGKGTPEEQIPLKDFKLAPAEKVKGNEARVITYRTASADGQNMSVTLWVDAKTLLPLKREVVLDDGAGRMSETYDLFWLDPKTDVDPFQLPK